MICSSRHKLPPTTINHKIDCQIFTRKSWRSKRTCPKRQSRSIPNLRNPIHPTIMNWIHIAYKTVFLRSLMTKLVPPNTKPTKENKILCLRAQMSPLGFRNLRRQFWRVIGHHRRIFTSLTNACKKRDPKPVKPSGPTANVQPSWPPPQTSSTSRSLPMHPSKNNTLRFKSRI